MLFNSFEFIFIFLPVALIIFYLIGDQGHHRIAISWLIGASLFFYGWWNPSYLILILGSMLFNYAFGISLSNNKIKKNRKILLVTGIGINISLLAYYKYANFFVTNLNSISGSNFHLETIILPLAISFFTFQQIAYLVDAYRNETREYNFLHYCLFVTFFPQLIAGPIVHHREMLPQFAKNSTYKFYTDSLSIGLTIFIIGLFKKIVIADELSIYVTPVFMAADNGETLTFFEAWGGALAYTFQLYFDFSGYSDMAIGLARMFNIKLPLNFHSPYKATSIIDFWRRWHITLSRFLRDYLYFALGGSRKGKIRRYANLMITMILGGLWHGAGWTFIAWGALHGTYLMINHAWRSLATKLGHDTNTPSRATLAGFQLLTFFAVVISWVFFRANSFEAAINVLKGMSGFNGITLKREWLILFGDLGNYLQNFGINFGPMTADISTSWAISIIVAWFISWFMPNTQEYMQRYIDIPGNLKTTDEQSDKKHIVFSFSLKSSITISVILFITLLTIMSIQKSVFLYYDF